jgi:hypothetical protein
MLTMDKNKNLICKYIFSDYEVGSYRNAPFIAIFKYAGEKETSKDIAKALINLFTKKKVAFIDLISFPLPQISTGTRKKFTKYKKDDKDYNYPFVVKLLDASLDDFTCKTRLKFSDNLKIVFMMPSTLSNGIIRYCLLNEKNLESDNPFLKKHFDIITRVNTIVIIKNGDSDNPIALT